jgi:hypothetical protein
VGRLSMVIDMSETAKQDHSSLIAEVNAVTNRLLRSRELVVMAQPQMATMSSSTFGTSQHPADFKARMERLPDFQEQMRSNPEFRRAYASVLAAIDL